MKNVFILLTAFLVFLMGCVMNNEELKDYNNNKVLYNDDAELIEINNQELESLKGHDFKLKASYKVESKMSFLHISGWAFVEGYSTKGFEHYVILKNKDKIVKVALNKNIRRDVTKHFNTGLNLDESGFDIKIPYSLIDKSVYLVYVLSISKENNIVALTKVPQKVKVQSVKEISQTDILKHLNHLKPFRMNVEENKESFILEGRVIKEGIVDGEKKVHIIIENNCQSFELSVSDLNITLQKSEDRVIIDFKHVLYKKFLPEGLYRLYISYEQKGDKEIIESDKRLIYVNE